MLPGNRYDTVAVAPLIENINLQALIADKAFDANWILRTLDERNVQAVISQRPQRIAPLEIDEEMYKWRHLIENFFQRLKEYKRIATRYDKTDTSYASFFYLCAAIVNSS